MSATAEVPAGVPAELPARLFCRLYPEYGLYMVDGMHVAVPREDPLSADSPVFAGASLGDVARQISEFAPGLPSALETLRRAWGNLYDIGFADCECWARRLEGGDLLTAATPDELSAAIRDDWAAGEGLP